jgi:hypothetical protein
MKVREGRLCRCGVEITNIFKCKPTLRIPLPLPLPQACKQVSKKALCTLARARAQVHMYVRIRFFTVVKSVRKCSIMTTTGHAICTSVLTAAAKRLEAEERQFFHNMEGERTIHILLVFCVRIHKHFMEEGGGG